MRLIDEIQVMGLSGRSTIQLLVGDLARIPQDHAVDILTVSAFPDNYATTSGTLIAALDRIGVSVAALAKDKEEDLRQTSSCWISRPINRAGFNAHRILCFEPRYRQSRSASRVVGDLFRSLVPVAATASGLQTIAMPMLATGNQREDHGPMLKALVETANHWIVTGLPIACLKIVVFDEVEPHVLKGIVATFRELQTKLAAIEPLIDAPAHGTPDADEPEHDLFISYAHVDGASVEMLVQELRFYNPGLRIFVDRLHLETGAAWQERIFNAVSNSRHVLCLYSPEYLSSKPCMEELHVGLLREREEGGILFPAYLRSTRLPAYLRAIQYEDVRESDPERITRLASALTARLNQTTTATRTPPPAPTVTASASVRLQPETLRALLAGDIELRVDITLRPRTTTDNRSI